MTNIWRYSLIFAFTVIIDQLIKGTTQGFLGSQESLVLFDYLIIKEVKTSQISLWTNRFLYCSSVLFLIYMMKNTIVYRNKSFINGLFRTFIMIGLFTTFLDLSSMGYFVDYIYLFKIPLSLGKILFIIGAISLLFINLKGKSSETHTV